MTGHSPSRRIIIAFDMDGTLIADRLIYRLADRFSFRGKLEDIMAMDIPEYRKTRRIARLLRGITARELLYTLEQIPLSVGAKLVTRQLKEQGHFLVIISDSYTLATEHLKVKLGFERTVANRLVIIDGKITGEIEMPLNWSAKDSECLKYKYSVCKLNSLIEISEEMNIPLKNCVAIGDNMADIGMLRGAGIGVAFNPKSRLVESSADVVLKNDLGELLESIDALGR